MFRTFIRKKPICKPLPPLPRKERQKAQKLQTENILILNKTNNSKSPRCATYLSNEPRRSCSCVSITVVPNLLGSRSYRSNCESCLFSELYHFSEFCGFVYFLVFSCFYSRRRSRPPSPLSQSRSVSRTLYQDIFNM